MFYVTGLAFEKTLLQGSQRPTEGVLDGISFHTDHVEVNAEFYEIKSTRKSSNKGFEDLGKNWHKQFLSYMKTTGRTDGHFAILHLMGNYAPPFPDLIVYHVEATQKEIDDNWDWMLERLAILKTHEEAKLAPKQYKYRVVDWGGADKDFECGDCPYAAMCSMREQGLL